MCLFGKKISHGTMGKGDVQIGFFDIIVNKDNDLNATAIKAISDKYYGRKDFKKTG